MNFVDNFDDKAVIFLFVVFATTIVLGIGIFTFTFLFWCIFGFCVHIHLEIAPRIKLFEKVINKN